MSYTIFYDRQFIKVDDRIIPLILQGDNNVYEASNRKRARDWGNSTWTTKGQLMAHGADIIKAVDDFREDQIASHKEPDNLYTDKSFGWCTGISMNGKSCGTTTFGMFKNFYVTGINEAMTIEELLNHNIQIELFIYCYDQTEFLKKTGLKLLTPVVFTSTAHLIETVAAWETYYGDVRSLNIRVYGNIERMKKSNKPAKAKKQKSYVATKVFFVLESNYGIFIKSTSRGYRYSSYTDGGKRFLTQDQANRFHSKMRSKDLFKVRRIDSPREVNVLV